MTVQSIATYAGAIESGMPFWRLQISNWGNRGATTDANSLTYVAAAIKGAQYVVIGPDSTADEVNVAYNDLAIQNTAFAVPNPGVLNQISMTVGINRPGVILGGDLTIRTAISTMFGDTYFRDGVAAAQTFGGAQPLFEAPNLQLLFYPQLPTAVPLPKRNDMYRSFETNATGDVGAETLIAIWPIMGRTKQAVFFRATGTLVGTIRVAVISSFVGNTVGAPTVRPAEDTVAAALAIDATTGVQASSEPNRLAQYISLYYTRSAGAGTIISNLIASDR
jgi:hypothetical protein